VKKAHGNRIHKEFRVVFLDTSSFSANLPLSLTPFYMPSITQVRVQPGQEISMYVHSELGSDMAIVYDNMRWASGATHDQYLQVDEKRDHHTCS
jgi:hypothetical protein